MVLFLRNILAFGLSFMVVAGILYVIKYFSGGGRNVQSQLVCSTQQGVDITERRMKDDDNSLFFDAGCSGTATTAYIEQSIGQRRLTPRERSLASGKTDANEAPALWDVSAYCPKSCCCGEFADGVTASGHVIKPGDKFCAADKNIPFGTMIDIPGYGVVPVLDRGGAICGNKLDVYFDSHQAALNWGRQRLTVEILNR